jgi:hypothetical protein
VSKVCPTKVGGLAVREGSTCVERTPPVARLNRTLGASAEGSLQAAGPTIEALTDDRGERNDHPSWRLSPLTASDGRWTHSDVRRLDWARSVARPARTVMS